MALLKSLQNAAIVLQNLPKAQAAKVMARMEASDLRSVFKAMESLDAATSTQVFNALGELAREAEKVDRHRRRTGTATPAAFKESRSNENASLYSDSYRDSPFHFLIRLSPHLIHQLLRDEHPKHIAEVLANLPPEIASEQIQNFEPILRISIVKRICEIEDKASPETHELAFALKLRLKKLLGKNRNHEDGLSIAARLLNLSSETTRTEVLTKIGQVDPELESKLQKCFVGFEDLAKLCDDDIKVLLKNTDTSFWAPALKHASPGIQKKIMRNMANKVGDVLAAEINAIGPVPESISREAQQQILEICANLSKDNQIRGLSQT